MTEMPDHAVIQPAQVNFQQRLIKRDLYWLRKALFEAEQCSKDPEYKVAAIAVMNPETENIHIASAYNGFPRGTNDSEVLYHNKGYKDAMMIHAEANLICNAARQGASLNHSTVYITHTPCIHCATKLVQAGASRIVTIKRPLTDRFIDKFKINLATDLFRALEKGYAAYEEHAVK